MSDEFDLPSEFEAPEPSPLRDKLKQMSLADLREELAARKIDTLGLVKPELIAKLEEILLDERKVREENERLHQFETEQPEEELPAPSAVVETKTAASDELRGKLFVGQIPPGTTADQGGVHLLSTKALPRRRRRSKR